MNQPGKGEGFVSAREANCVMIFSNFDQLSDPVLSHPSKHKGDDISEVILRSPSSSTSILFQLSAPTVPGAGALFPGAGVVLPFPPLALESESPWP